MKHNDVDGIAKVLSLQYGMKLTVNTGGDVNNPHFSLIPQDLHRSEGFEIRVSFRWKTVAADFVPGNFSGALIREMGRSHAESLAAFHAFAQQVQNDGGTVRMRVNEIGVNPLDFSKWPDNWERLEIGIQRTYAFEDETEENRFNAARIWGGRMLGMILALLPLEEISEETDQAPVGLPEGARTRVDVNKYERNHLNRAVCIERLGTRCLVCSFDFEEMYGTIGIGYIHIHHTTPVSQIGPNYIIDPVRDLVPVCPNCHAMLHRKDPPFTIEELKSIMHKHGRRNTTPF